MRAKSRFRKTSFLLHTFLSLSFFLSLSLSLICPFFSLISLYFLSFFLSVSLLTALFHSFSLSFTHATTLFSIGRSFTTYNFCTYSFLIILSFALSLICLLLFLFFSFFFFFFFFPLFSRSFIQCIYLPINRNTTPKPFSLYVSIHYYSTPPSSQKLQRLYINSLFKNLFYFLYLFSYSYFIFSFSFQRETFERENKMAFGHVSFFLRIRLHPCDCNS
ncbi:unnamed protein product [Acanthosepion pharaonis]|uniref:Uncharacterized protein n=1 Tax=Acanthosepion pharaonis TaxID=158019 RepID=A0A812CUC6_ACAPH|nr:unnamed protein product [Sepia pharaonis]